jgi:hypothetical protein
MQRLSSFIIIINFFICLLLLCNSCKKEESFSKKDFIRAIQREWYVCDYSDGTGEGICLSFDGDSTVDQFCNYQYISITDPGFCNINGIKNIQYWTFTKYDEHLQLETQDFCGGKNSYIFEFDNFYANEQMFAPDIYTCGTTEARLINEDTTIHFYQFILDISINDTTAAEIYFEYEGRNPSARLRPLY